MNLDNDCLKIEVGRVRSMEEIRAAWEVVKPIAAKRKAAWDAAVAMAPGPEREEAFHKFQEERDRDELDVEEVNKAFSEIVPELEMIEEARLQIESVTESQARDEVLAKLTDLRLRLLTEHIRNARYWIQIFGLEATVRIDVFSWIIGVEPNYEHLMPEERAIFNQRINDMGGDN